MRKARMVFSILMAAATISLSSGVPLARAATPVPVTSVATQVGAPATPSTNARVQVAQAMTATEMESTVGGFWDWARDFVEGMVVGIIVAVIVIIVIAAL